MADQGPAPITIRKYANRRMYDTAASRYVTLLDLADMTRNGDEFVVVDAKSGNDLTRAVLLQIVVDQEGQGAGLLSIEFLRRLIGFHGDGLETLLARYLDQQIGDFAKNKDQIRRYVSRAMPNGGGPARGTAASTAPMRYARLGEAQEALGADGVDPPAGSTPEGSSGGRKNASIFKFRSR